ncbi:hypothetical protein ACOKM5_40375 [Streptomyces sp. BH097]|uniref:hypothetical protein n=1 Tax=unclassified Streptomyces TaxID=2593676 RepID=UPI003BB490F3
MPRPIPTGRRAWIATWAGVCAAGLAATCALNTSSKPDPQPEEPVSARCAELIASVEKQLAKDEGDGKRDGVVAFSHMWSADEDDCHDALSDHFGGDW